MSDKCAVYCRVSTLSQTNENQILSLKRLATQMGHLVVAVYEDHGVSGVAKHKDARAKMLADARAGKFSSVFVASIDRLSRSVSDLLSVVDELNSLDVRLVSEREQIDTRTPLGKFFLTVLGSISSLEREIIRERINAGIARAQKQGKHCGRPTKINASVVKAVTLLRTKGVSIRDIAKTCQIGIGSVTRILKGQEPSIAS